MSPERRNVILALVAAFVFGVSGGVVGTLGTLAVLHHLGPFGPGAPFGPQRGMLMRRHGGPGEPGGPGGMRAERAPMERLLAHHLDLTDEQRSRVEKILESEWGKLFQSYGPGRTVAEDWSEAGAKS